MVGTIHTSGGQGSCPYTYTILQVTKYLSRSVTRVLCLFYAYHKVMLI